jgi:hypothetical protein
VVLITGHGKLWMKDNDAFGKGEPGIGMAAAYSCQVHYFVVAFTHAAAR